jgi:hypothetical protein
MDECIQIYKDEILEEYNNGESEYVINDFNFNGMRVTCHIYFYQDINEDNDDAEELCFSVYFFIKEKDIFSNGNINLTVEFNEIQKLFFKEFRDEINNCGDLIERILKFLLFDFRQKHIYSKIKDEIIPIETKDVIEKKQIAKYILVDNYYIENCCVCLENNVNYTKCKHNLCRLCKINIINTGVNKCCPICRNIFF